MRLDPQKGVLVLDFETSSALPIKVGAWPYSEHSSTVVLCAVFCYATPDGGRHWFPWEPGDELPREIVDFVRDGGLVVAHNYFFEHSIWTNVCRPCYGWPPIDVDQWRDTQILSRCANLPSSLDGVGKALGLKVQKDKVGKALMLEMCLAVPDDLGGWIYPKSRNAKARARLLKYCKIDVAVTADAYFALPRMSVLDSLGWLVDKRINTRGVFLDEAFASKCTRLAKTRKAELAADAFRTTNAELDNATNSNALRDWIKSHGVELPKTTRQKSDGSFTKTETVDKTACAQILERDDVPDVVREVLSNRIEANKATSLAKLLKVPELVGTDGRLRGALAFAGANTGRWASYGLQLHNLPKNHMGPNQTALAFACCDREDLSMLKLAEDRPLEAMSRLLRSVVRAAPGHELIAADYAAIEARVVAWLAGQDDILLEFDAGTDVYVYTAESIGSASRQLGKVCVLALGYGMGVVKFHTTAAAWGVPIELSYARDVQKSWRESNAQIVAFWRELDAAVREAIENPLTTHYVGPRRVQVRCTRSALKITLPSGRDIYYWRPRLVWAEKIFETVDEDGVIVKTSRKVQEIQYFAPERGLMARKSTYGGKLVENVTQAVARDLLTFALPIIDRTDPYRVVLHVHDSIAAEVPAGAGDVDEFCTLMERKPAWARGLPIAADGYRDVRFRG